MVIDAFSQYSAIIKNIANNCYCSTNILSPLLMGLIVTNHVKRIHFYCELRSYITAPRNDKLLSYDVGTIAMERIFCATHHFQHYQHMRVLLLR